MIDKGVGLNDKSLSTPIPKFPLSSLISLRLKYPSSLPYGVTTYPKQISLSIESSVIYHDQPFKNSLQKTVGSFCSSVSYSFGI